MGYNVMLYVELEKGHSALSILEVNIHHFVNVHATYYTNIVLHTTTGSCLETIFFDMADQRRLPADLHDLLHSTVQKRDLKSWHVVKEDSGELELRMVFGSLPNTTDGSQKDLVVPPIEDDKGINDECDAIDSGKKHVRKFCIF